MARSPKRPKIDAARRVVGLRVQGHIYRAVLTPDSKVGGYTVRVQALPGCITEGDTLTEAKRMAREAVEVCLAVKLRPPARSS